MDALDRHIARNIAKQVLIRTDPDQPDAAFRVEFASGLLDRVAEEEQHDR